MSGLPTLQVLADFSGGGLAGTPTTDITAYVDMITGYTITAGRQDEDGAISPTQATLSLDNTDGRFTPYRSASPYYPNVDVGVRIQIIETFGGTAFPRFDGYVDSWTGSLDGGFDANMAVAATDILGRFGDDTPIGALVLEEMLVDAPAAVYTLQEEAGAIGFGDSSKNSAAAGSLITSKYGAGKSVATVGDDNGGNFADPATVVTLANLGIGVNGEQAGYVLQFPSAIANAAAWSLDFWFQRSGIPTANPECLLSSYGASGTQVYVAIDQTGQILAAVNGAQNGRVGTYCDGQLHHVCMAVGGGFFQLFVDGVLAGSLGSVSAVGPTAPFWFGMSGTSTLGLIAYGADAGYAYFGQYASAISGTRALAHFNAGQNGCNTDTTVQRINRLLTYRTSASAALTSTCSGTMAAQDAETMDQAILDCGAAEGTAAYISPTGQIVLVPRQFYYGNGQVAPSVSTAPVCTFDSSLDQVEIGTTFIADAQYVANQVVVDRPGGAAQTLNNLTSQGKYGIRPQSITLPVVTDADAALGAAFILSQGAVPGPRTTTLEVDLLTEPLSAQVKAILGITPLSKIQATSLPSQFPASTLSLIAQGWTESVSQTAWTISFNCSPALSPAVLQLDTGGAASQLDTGLIFGW